MACNELEGVVKKSWKHHVLHTFSLLTFGKIYIGWTYKKYCSISKYLLHFPSKKFKKSIAICLKKCYNTVKVCKTGLLCPNAFWVSKKLVLSLMECATYPFIGGCAYCVSTRGEVFCGCVCQAGEKPESVISRAIDDWLVISDEQGKNYGEQE